MGPSLHDPRSPDDLLNYRLKRLFALGGAPVVRLCEGRYGISRREWRLLALLVDAQPPLSPSELAERAHLDLARTSRVIAALVDKGFARRETRSDDRRRAVVTATPEGARLHRQLFPQIAAINAQIVSVLDSEQLKVLDELLQALTRQAEALNASVQLDSRADRSRSTRRGPAAGAAGVRA
jgi:DNA-binding MarR family transcriptional regulator